MKKVLIVEDDSRICKVLSLRVSTLGIQVVSAADATEGINQVLKTHPNLVVLDIGMPGGSGFAVAERIRSNKKAERTPIVFLTASRDPEIRSKARSYNPYAFIEKPYDNTKLMSTILAGLGQAEQFS